jgi:Domain of unknown function (DUF5615)
MPEYLRFYMDVHVPAAISKGLRTRGIAALTAQEDNHAQAPDSVVLDRAAFLGYVVYTNDTDFLEIVAQRHHNAIFFAGVVYSQQKTLTFGRIIADLELIATCCSSAEMQNQLVYLPLG